MGQSCVLGVDPGTRQVGWAVVSGTASEARRLGSGVLRLGESSHSLGARLQRLRIEISALLKQHRPRQLVLESAYFGKNARSALRLGESRGVIMVTAEEYQVGVLELPPALVKRRVAGSGAATKEQVARLVSAQFGGLEFEAEDESDALAIALCGLLAPAHAHPPTRGRGPALPPGASLQS